jgi:uncharacterized protein YgbK (DUF1537 family)
VTIRLGLVADDVTGAGDAAVQFAKRGWDTFLTLKVGSDGTASETIAPLDSQSAYRVFALTTDSRALPDGAAEQRTFEALGLLIQIGIDRVFLKIDSTMRGSVAGQIRGALAAWRTRYEDAHAIVCPAYPRMGRTVESGQLLVHGEPVDRMAIGRDPVSPVKTSDMRQLSPAAPSISIADAAGDEALHDLARTIVEAGPAAIAVGSGGLAEAVAAVLTGSTTRSDALDRARRMDQVKLKAAGGDRILLLVTSLNPVSHTQVARVREAFPNATVVLAPTERVSNGFVAEKLAREFAAHVDRGRWDLVGLVGGDGARAALEQLGASGIRIMDSLVEGIPFGLIAGGRADGLPVFTKAGGFGSEDALVKTIQRAAGEWRET